jgi:hypothetical protein
MQERRMYRNSIEDAGGHIGRWWFWLNPLVEFVDIPHARGEG